MGNKTSARTYRIINGKKDIDNYKSLETLYSQLEELIQKIMQLQENFSLKQYNTFQVEAKALFFIEVHSIEELKEALHFSKEKAFPI